MESNIWNESSQITVTSESLLFKPAPVFEWGYNMANPNKESYVPLTGLVKVLKLSGATSDVVEQILTVAVSDEGSITKDDFYLSLKLLALAQQKRPITLDEVAVASSEILLPIFDQKLMVHDRTESLASSFISNRSVQPSPFEDRNSVSNPWGNTEKQAEAPIEEPKVPLPSYHKLSRSDSYQFFSDRDRVIVSISDKGGMLFKHVNYRIESPFHHSSVIRRYSDFVILNEVFAKKYVFRLIPPLPPKKIGATGDEEFIEIRRRGLVRYLNFLSNHPILRNDELFIDFLKVDQEFQVYKRTITVSTEHEFVTYRDTWKPLLASLPNDIDEKLGNIREILNKSKAQFTSWINLMTEAIDKMKGFAGLYGSFTAIAETFVADNKCWKLDCSPCSSITKGLKEVKTALQTTKNSFLEQAANESEDTIDRFQGYFELLCGATELYDRVNKSIVTDMEPINKRIQGNQQKLEKMIQRVGKDAEKIVAQIEADQQEISFLQERNAFAKYCLWAESEYFHKHRVLISILFQKFSYSQRKFYGNVFENWDHIITHVNDMALSGF